MNKYNNGSKEYSVWQNVRIHSLNYAISEFIDRSSFIIYKFRDSNKCKYESLRPRGYCVVIPESILIINDNVIYKWQLSNT